MDELILPEKNVDVFVIKIILTINLKIKFINFKI